MNNKNKTYEYPRASGDLTKRASESGDLPIVKLLKQSAVAALIALVLFFHLIGMRTVDQAGGLGLNAQWIHLAVAVAAVFAARFIIGLLHIEYAKRKGINTGQGSAKAMAQNTKRYNAVLLMLMLMAFALPFSFLSSRYLLDVLTLIFTYVILAYGLSLVVGMVGLLDLGFVAYYAIGAYTYALLAQYAGIGFWQALPLVMLVAACVSGVLGLIVLRLRGDYYAIVTLGFAEILRIVILNLVSITGGPNGMSGIARPTFFGIVFAPMDRVIFLYYVALAFVIVIYLVLKRIRALPLGRAFEAVREDERAAEALGIPLTRTKLAATMLAAAIGALAGAFFATRQGFISPESFTFTESALVLAIVVLGGAGHMLGLIVAALFLVGLPEVFRELQDYRMLAFGAGMVLIMILRPAGLFSRRAPSLFYEKPVKNA